MINGNSYYGINNYYLSELATILFHPVDVVKQQFSSGVITEKFRI